MYDYQFVLPTTFNAVARHEVLVEALRVARGNAHLRLAPDWVSPRDWWFRHAL